MTALVVDYPMNVGRPSAPFPRRPFARRRPSPAVIRRRRLGVALVLVGIAFLAIVGTLDVQAVLGRTGSGPLSAAGAGPGLRLAADQVWVVQPGDTVWSIARSVEPGADVRPLVDRIDAELKGAPLYPGERIRIPRT